MSVDHFDARIWILGASVSLLIFVDRLVLEFNAPWKLNGILWDPLELDRTLGSVDNLESVLLSQVALDQPPDMQVL